MFDPLTWSFIWVAILGLIWKYSSLPEIDWKYIASGAMVLFLGWAVDLLARSIALFASTINLNILVGIIDIIGALLVIIGATINAINQLKAK